MKNGLQEIISSGRAPGILAGSPAVDPDSVMAKAPKALAQMERGERRSKRGISARDISRHFGMSVDFIKHTWSRPFKKKAVVNLIILALLWHSYPVQSADITPGTSFNDGQTVSAAQLALLASGTINTSFYTSKTIDPTPLSSDYLLVYSPTLLGFYKTTAGSLFSANYQQTVTGATPGTPALTDLFPFFNSNTNLYNTTFSNLIQQISIYENMASWQFAPTNANSSNTNVFVLSQWPGAFGSAVPGTNMPELLVWGTNGIPYQATLLTAEQAMAGDGGTNLSVPYVFQEIWSPWSFYGFQTNIYGTNGSGLPLSTNAWGFTTNFPIQHLFLTNAFNPTNSTQTLTNQDTVPVYASGQLTNTTFTLQALYEYLTNRNTLPPYTVARIQFSGIPLTLSISNNANTTAGLINYTTNATFQSGQIYCVDVITNGTQIIWGGIQTNTPYFLVPTTTNTMWALVYSNYNDALLGVRNIPILLAGAGTLEQIQYLTNFTSFDLDAIQLTAGTTAVAGYYDCWFRAPAANSLYYVTGNAMNSAVNPTADFIFNLAIDYHITTNDFHVSATFYNNTAVQTSPLIHVLVNPQ